MESKVCFKCDVEKSLDEYYRHKRMKDGHLNKCKMCARADSKARSALMARYEDWREAERARGREKYKRLGYKDKYRATSEQNRKYNTDRKLKYPEKYKASIASQRLPALSEHKHHWSYRPEHVMNVIHLTIREHTTLHRYMIYDDSYMLYRKVSDGSLLDTEVSHLDLLEEIKTF